MLTVKSLSLSEGAVNGQVNVKPVAIAQHNGYPHKALLAQSLKFRSTSFPLRGCRQKIAK